MLELRLAKHIAVISAPNIKRSHDVIFDLTTGMVVYVFVFCLVPIACASLVPLTGLDGGAI